MTRRRTLSSSPKPSRRWHIPPPLIHGPEALEGANVLQEVPDALGVVLWQSLRDVMLWSQTPPARRSELFTPGAHERARIARERVDLPMALRYPLRVLTGVNGTPVSEDSGAISEACREISEWAEEQGLASTALAFAQNAALASPSNPAAAYRVGRIARLSGDHARAEVWLRRTIGLARQARNWRLYSLAFRSLGNLYLRRGNLRAARRLQVRALRGARRGGMRSEQGQALHDLFVIEVEANNPPAAEAYALQAFQAYSPRNPRLPRLAHDLAYFWMERGHFASALPVFRALLPLFVQPIEQLFTTADIARAAGGVGDADLFDWAWSEVWEQSENPQVAEGLARAFLDLARGAASQGDRGRAIVAAERAHDLAMEQGEAKVRLTAEALLDSLHNQPSLSPSSPSPSASVQPDARLASDLIRALENLSVATV